MKNVEDLDKKVKRLERKSYCGLLTSYEFVMKGYKILDSIQRFYEEGRNFGAVLFNQDTIYISREDKLSEILHYIQDDNIKIVGIYGMGGVGKTTILKRIREEMLINKRHEFQSIIWITVSQDVNVTSIDNV
jgi:Icc-related predicted phosphoesterase